MRNQMTKLSNQKIPGRGVPFVYCKSCRDWVPDMAKHDKKIHPGGAFKNDIN